MTDLPDLKIRVIPAMPTPSVALSLQQVAFQHENRLRMLEGAPLLTFEQFKQMVHLP